MPVKEKKTKAQIAMAAANASKSKKKVSRLHLPYFIITYLWSWDDSDTVADTVTNTVALTARGGLERLCGYFLDAEVGQRQDEGQGP